MLDLFSAQTDWELNVYVLTAMSKEMLQLGQLLHSLTQSAKMGCHLLVAWDLADVTNGSKGGRLLQQLRHKARDVRGLQSFNGSQKLIHRYPAEADMEEMRKRKIH